MLIPALPPEPARRIAGWAVRWRWSSAIDCPRRGRFIESIEPCAFSEAIARGRVELWFDHDRSQGTIARQADGTLLLRADAVGLWFDARVPSSDLGEVALDVVRGAGYRAASVGMVDVVDQWDHTVSPPVRTIRLAGLREVSLCRHGAHESARVAAGRLPIEALKATA